MIYVDKAGRMYAVLSWTVPCFREHRMLKKYKAGYRDDPFDEWSRYPVTKWSDTREEAEAELKELAQKKGWTLVPS